MPTQISLKGLAVVFTLLLLATPFAAPLSAERAAAANLPAPASTSPSSADDPHFLFRSLRDRPKIKLVGQAWIKQATDVMPPGDDVLRLTDQSTPGQVGAAWYTSTMSIDQGFETMFDVRIASQGSPGDGFSFVIHNDIRGRQALGEGGCSGGYAGAGKITNSFAIEFDTFPNPPYCANLDEPGFPHIALLGRGEQAPMINQGQPNTYNQPNITKIIDGKSHTIKIRYTTDPRQTPLPRLDIFFDDMTTAVLSRLIDLGEYVDAPDGRAWVGFVAGTGAFRETNDIRNWYFRSGRELNCGLEYDFTSGEEHKNFNADAPRGGATWPAYTSQQGWQSIAGKLAITRGFGLGSGFLNHRDGLDPTLRNLIFRAEHPQPIEQIKLVYSWKTSDGAPASANHELNADIDMVVSDSVTISIGQQDLTALPPALPLVETDQFSLLALDEEDVARAFKPTEFRIRLTSSVSTDVIRLKRLAVCINNPIDGSSRPPVLPFGSARACAELLNTLHLLRWQPLGQGVSKQPELQMPEHVNLTLEPYPEYSLGAATYPNWLQYDSNSWARVLPAGISPPKLVPCVFLSDGDFYNPQPLPQIDGPPSRNQIVRFTALDGTHDTRQMLVLLNYAAYFSVGSGTWCYASDNVFTTINNRSNADNYGTGYNVPSPQYDCDTLTPHGGSNGPCGSFVGSLFRAMGYYDVDAIATAYDQIRAAIPGAAPSTVMAALDLHNLYYGVDAYVRALPRNKLGRIDPPLILRGQNDQPIPITYTGIRTYPYEAGTEAAPKHFFGLALDGKPIHPVKCPSPAQICEERGGCTNQQGVALNCWLKPGECIEAICRAGDEGQCQRVQLCAQTQAQLDGHWDDPTHNLLSPLSRNIADPDVVWRQIKPGDIAITLTEAASADLLYTHIQVVVGWGPKPQGLDTSYVRYGIDLYPTYASLTPDQQQTFVPYVIDRFSQPGTGDVTGPRPFSLGLLHTATDFWVSSPAQ
jgi:hypothetical protein